MDLKLSNETKASYKHSVLYQNKRKRIYNSLLLTKDEDTTLLERRQIEGYYSKVTSGRKEVTLHLKIASFLQLHCWISLQLFFWLVILGQWEVVSNAATKPELTV